MKILSAEEIRLCDQYTIQHEPISSIDLMERAAWKCIEWIEQNNFAGKRFSIFCGKGNNGGDGLAIARMLAESNYPVAVYILEFGHKGTEDFQTNLARLHQYPEVDIRFVQTEENFHEITPDEIIIDALYGSLVCFHFISRVPCSYDLLNIENRMPLKRIYAKWSRN